MINQIILVGKIVEIGENKMAISIPRPHKNEDGEYLSDIVDITVIGNMFENIKEYCHKGDVVGIKGHLESENKGMQIVLEKVTFLSSKKEDDE